MSSGGVMAAEDMISEMRHSWQAMVTGYARLRHGLRDLHFPQSQLRALAGLMRYAKILLATAIAGLSQYSTVVRSPMQPLGDELDCDVPVCGPQQAGGGDAPEQERPEAAGALAAAEHSFLREVVATLCAELNDEVRDRGHLSAQLARYNDAAGAFRAEHNATHALRERLRELQSKAGLGPTPPPADPQPLVSECTALNVTLKEQCDRLKASSLKLRADKYALLADKGLLLDRVRALEARAVAAAQVTGHYRHSLTRAQKQASALLASRPPSAASPPPRQIARSATASPSPRPQQRGMVNVGGQEMELEVVEWLKRMYQLLSTDGGGAPSPERSAALTASSDSQLRLQGGRQGSPQAGAGDGGHSASALSSVSAPSAAAGPQGERDFAAHVADVRRRRAEQQPT
eukprot:TRINITY_DN8933_c0_g2_i1.p1 TRINITY_DN8933_c0_g2~~TRINITY_DN8933_c0_g2_i1.p1  ORF type:complete len:440 (+),score=119.64 TRINITY_DN8933_c0_g2_i1:110-1321(+)